MQVASMASFAQAPVGSVQFTPAVGATFANFSKGDADMRIGLIAGAEAKYQVTDVFALSAGAYYAQEGAKTSTTVMGVTATATEKNDYINVPVLVNAYVAPNLAVKLGLQPAFLLSSKLKGEAGGKSVDTDTKDAFESFDLAMPIGISYEYNNVVIDARYNFGRTNIGKEAKGDDKAKNSVFQVTLGYRF